MYYYPSQPPYFLLLIGFLIAFTCGLALSGTLQVITSEWRQIGKEQTKFRSPWKQLAIPFVGITGGVCLFMSSGLEIFGFPSLLALGIGLPLSLLTCLLVWFQLGSMLDFASSRGMKSLDLDSMS